MTTDHAIVICAAATMIAFGTVLYIFANEWLRYRAACRNFENEIAAERAVRETEG